MLNWIDWPVLSRQAALIIVPLIMARVQLPAELADVISAPAVEVVAAVIAAGGTAIVGWVIWIGQRREQPDAKIEAVAELPEVRKVQVKSDVLADSLGPKVVS